MGCQVLCNIADRPELCDFILPAVVEQGDLALAITTAGNSPALAKRLRRQLADQLGPEYARLTELLGAIRRRLLSKGHDPEAHQKVFNTLLDGDLLGLVRNDRRDAIDALLDATLGPDYRLENLLAEAKQTPNSGSITPKKSDNRQTSASGRKVE
jgi:precorrin-2 dehydrogenase/sirohydrochlorin ferrochelatase